MTQRRPRVALLAGGGGDVYYELGLCSGLASNGIGVDFIGSDFLKDSPILRHENVRFYNLRGSQDPASPRKEKVLRVPRYYLRLLRYARNTEATLFHIQWFNKFIHFDRTVLNLYYKSLGKKLVFTAHNVDEGMRDGTDSPLNRLSLKVLYRVADHIIVHTDKMRRQIIEGFDVRENKVSVVPYGINNVVYQSPLTRAEARRKLNLQADERAVLFFGRITPYKGLEDLLSALLELKKRQESVRLLIAGRVEKDAAKYWQSLRRVIKDHGLEDWVVEKSETVSDKDIEVYFKAADVLALPYRYIFQSGVLFLALNFGLPVIATDVGSLREFIIDGKTGFLCRAGDPVDLADKISRYFRSELFLNLDRNRLRIMEYAKEKYSWDDIARKTRSIYEGLLWKEGPFQQRT